MNQIKRCINEGCIYYSHTQANYCTEYKNIELCDECESELWEYLNKLKKEK